MWETQQHVSNDNADNARTTDTARSLKASLKGLATYFPIRYYACSIVLAYVLFVNFETIQTVEEQILYSMFKFFSIPSFYLEGSLFVGDVASSYKISLAIYTQLLFLTFFPTIAITARTSIGKRLKMLSFGMSYFFASTFLQFLAIVILFSVDNSVLSASFKAISIGLALVSGALFIEASLFYNITIPHPTRIRRIVSRNYTREFLFLGILIFISFLYIYFVTSFIQVNNDSPFAALVHINLYLNISTIIFFAIFLSNIVYELRWPNWLKYGKSKDLEYKPLSVSFVIPAYNEERLVRRCIESIDRAASHYSGKVEIVLVDDGSTDDTARIVSRAISQLRFSTGKLYSIPNSGKGFAVQYGLVRTSGDIIFRTDADSEMDEYLINPMINHYKDPKVGSVCGWVFPIEDKTMWQKAQCVLCANYLYTKRAQEIVDSIITQPGSSTSFRREAVMKAGGWIDNIFGEDGEITNRLSRMGYKEEFEQRSVVYTEHPASLKGLMQQRSRWGVAFYHSRGRNLRLVKENENPRSFVFIWNLLAHGLGLGKSMVWPFLVATILVGTLDISAHGIPFYIIAKLAAVQLIIILIQILIYAYPLKKLGKVHHLLYFPFIRLINMILNLIVKPQVVEILLFWSTKWKGYDDESFRALRKEVNRSIDPLYPSGASNHPSVQNVRVD